MRLGANRKHLRHLPSRSCSAELCVYCCLCIVGSDCDVLTTVHEEHFRLVTLVEGATSVTLILGDPGLRGIATGACQSEK